MQKKNKTIKKFHKAVPVTVRKGSADILRRLVFLGKKQKHAVLATVSDDEPYTSLVAYALVPDLTGLVFATPRKTRKYRNMAKNNSVSLLIDSRSNTAGDYMKAESITITGKACSLKKGKKKDELGDVLLRKHPGLREFIHAPSTALIFVKIIKCIHVSSFQTVSEYRW